jgi:hypothetical protein
MQQPVSLTDCCACTLGIGTGLANVPHREFVLEQGTLHRKGEYTGRGARCQEFCAHYAQNRDHFGKIDGITLA